MIPHTWFPINAFVAKHNFQLRLSTDLESISKMTLCPFNDIPRNKCLEWKCNACGINAINDHYAPLKQEHQQDLVTYNIWEKVDKVTEKTGKICLVTELVTKKSKLQDVIDGLTNALAKLSAHLFRAAWQQAQLKLCKEHMPPKSATIIIDYAENYSCLAQDEVQSAHWSKTQATIHPVMAFINEENVVGPFTHKTSIICISDDLKHDADGVAHFMSKVYPYLKQKHGISHVEVFSDCCAGQYRCSKSFADLALHPKIYHTTINHNYFESSHGKSSADGLGAVVKHGASKAVMRQECVIRNPRELYNFCQEHLTGVGESLYQSVREKYAKSNHVFFYVDKHEVQRPRSDMDMKTIPGTMKIHSAAATGVPSQVQIRNLSCHCQNCLDG